MVTSGPLKEYGEIESGISPNLQFTIDSHFQPGKLVDLLEAFVFQSTYRET